MSFWSRPKKLSSTNNGYHNRPYEKIIGRIIRWKIKKNTVVAVIHKKILIRFMKMLLINIKCPLNNVYKLD